MIPFKHEQSFFLCLARMLCAHGWALSFWPRGARWELVIESDYWARVYPHRTLQNAPDIADRLRRRIRDGILPAAVVLACLACLGCGGDAFTEAIGAAAAADAGAAGDEHAPLAIRIDTGRPDAGAVEAAAGDEASSQKDVGTSGDAASDSPTSIDAPVTPAADAGPNESASPSGDASDADDEPPPPPPPALCCATPCSGSQVAVIQCSTPAWTCDDQAGNSCSMVRCAVGTGCHWQGTTCAGTVTLCP